MANQDRQHFEAYTEQNRVKHRILVEYIPAYLNALKRNVQRFHYIDGFAGPGHYEGAFPGSPLLVIDKIVDASVAPRTVVSCVEADPEFCDQLQKTLSSYDKAAHLQDSPLVRHGKFSDHVDEILNHPVYQSSKLDRDVATFAFVDPCGVSGVRLSDIARLLSLPYGECLLFFNYSGVNRMIGGIEAGSHNESILLDLLGTQSRVQDLMTSVRGASAHEREVLVRDHFISAVKEKAGTEFFVPFAVQAPDKTRTSHYLIHCSGHGLAYKIMKHVMYSASNARDDEFGRLIYLREDELGQQLAFFRPDIDSQKQNILDELSQGPRKPSVFRDEWVRRPKDPYSDTQYATMLIQLEQDGEIEVYDKNNKEPRPANKRMRKGKPTMGDVWLRRSRR